MEIKDKALAEAIQKKHPHISPHDARIVVKTMVEAITQQLIDGDSVRVYGFGLFRVRYRAPTSVYIQHHKKMLAIPGRYRPQFKPGLAMRYIIDPGKLKGTFWGARKKETAESLRIYLEEMEALKNPVVKKPTK